MQAERFPHHIYLAKADGLTTSTGKYRLINQSGPIFQSCLFAHFNLLRSSLLINAFSNGKTKTATGLAT
jgi:hypothetical protein